MDPRPQFSAALDQTERLVGSIEPDDRGRATPCGEYDVPTLAAHLVAVLRKLATAGRGGDATQVTDPADDLDDEATAFGRARADLERVWASDALLDEAVTLPWATMPGREVLDAYTHELTVHSWDLAVGLGSTETLDPALAEAAREWFTRNLPADERGEAAGFGPAVTVADDAPAYTRLAAYVGRTVEV